VKKQRGEKKEEKASAVSGHLMPHLISFPPLITGRRFARYEFKAGQWREGNGYGTMPSLLDNQLLQ
jgi:hypothetical protein